MFHRESPPAPHTPARPILSAAGPALGWWWGEPHGRVPGALLPLHPRGRGITWALIPLGLLPLPPLPRVEGEHWPAHLSLSFFSSVPRSVCPASYRSVSGGAFTCQPQVLSPCCTDLGPRP